MQEFIKKYLTNDQIDQWHYLPYEITHGKQEKKFLKGKKVKYPWVKISKNIVIWEKFWNVIFKGHKTNKVIDFGCGVGWSWIIGKELGFNVIPFDINEPTAIKLFKPFIKILNTPVTYWDGVKMTFKDDEFDSLVSKASMMKCAQTTFEILISELCRIVKPSGVWYVGPKYNQYLRLLRELKTLSHLKKKLDDKNIKIKCWNFPRNP